MSDRDHVVIGLPDDPVDGELVQPAWARGLRRLIVTLAGRLPQRWHRYVPPSLVGFALTGGLTFAIDLAILAALRTWTALPLPACVACSYLVAFGINFLLNRRISFASHSPVGPQIARFAVVEAVDFAMTVGVTSGFAALGLEFAVARLGAGLCVATTTYLASRYWVFRD